MTLFLIDIPGTAVNLSDVIVLIVTVTVGAAAFLKAAKAIWKFGPKQAWVHFIDWIKVRRSRKMMLATVMTQNETILKSQERIEAELTPNGGSSLKDMVITSLKSIEHLQARVRHQDEVSRSAIFELNESGDMIYTNAAFRDMLGAEDGELLYKNYISKVRAADRRRFQDEINQSIENLMPIDSIVDFFFDGHGYVTVRLQATPDVKSGGVLNAFFGTAARVVDGVPVTVPADCPILPNNRPQGE